MTSRRFFWRFFDYYCNGKMYKMISKNDILNYFFGDVFRYFLYKFKISPLVIAFLVIAIGFYFFSLRKHKKGSKFNRMEKLYIGILVIGFILAIFTQIILIIRQ